MLSDVKNISTFEFSTLYTKITHHLLKNVLSDIIDFVFKGKAIHRLGFICIVCIFDNKRKRQTLYYKLQFKGVSFLSHFQLSLYIWKCYIQQIGIDCAPFWPHPFLYCYENKSIQPLISGGSKQAFLYKEIVHFIDDLCVSNDNFEFNGSFKYIYPPELELKVENQGNYSIFLDIDIKIINGKYIYKLFDKRV